MVFWFFFGKTPHNSPHLLSSEASFLDSSTLEILYGKGLPFFTFAGM